MSAAVTKGAFESQQLESSEKSDIIMIEEQVADQKAVVSSKTRILGALNSFHTFINPKNTVKDTGMPRVICLEFLRGIAIFVMLAGHEAETMFDQSQVLKPTFNGIMSTIFGAPFALFGAYRTFFVLISGAAHSYSFFAKCFDKPPAQFLVQQCMEFLGSIVVLPLFFAWHIINAVGYGFQWGTMDLGYPLWRSAASYCHAVMYFGFSTPISVAVLTLMYCVLVLPFRARLKKTTILYVFYGACLAMATIWSFLFMDFADVLRKAFARRIGKNAADFANYECPGNESYNDDTFSKRLASIGMHFMAGEYMQFNMQYVFCIVGFALGAVLSLAYHEKKRILSLGDDDGDQRLKQYKTMKMLVHLLLSLPAAYFAVLTAPIMIEGANQVKSGRRKTFFTFSDFMSVFFPNNCIYPEYAVPELATEILLFYFAFLLFECTTNAKGRVRAERILYLRRFSTYSLSCFVFGYYVSPLLRTVLNLSRERLRETPLAWWAFLLYCLAYYVVVLFIHLGLDSIQGKFTPDWFMKVCAHAFSAGRKGAWRPMPENHLNIKQLTLCSKDLE